MYERTSAQKKTGKTAAEIADTLGLRSATTISKWTGTASIPARHILLIEEKFGIPRKELRPDLYRPAAPSSDAAATSGVAE
ncbi:hypothetical protein DTI93_09225 [Parasaccharibacter sp. TMW 2.1884]|nr:hypothetical protein [Parasaccharibacter sp. TMW 2.1884]